MEIPDPFSEGKSLIINTLALSGLWYTGSVVQLSAWAEKRISQIIFDFLWSTKNEQIKCEVCYLPYELGGLKVVNVALKCKAKMGPPGLVLHWSCSGKTSRVVGFSEE